MTHRERDAGTPFPLPLPSGMSAKRLQWGTTAITQHPEVAREVGWIVEADMTDRERTSSSTWLLGRPALGRHLCLHRFKLWWMKPSHGLSGLDVPPETSLLIAELSRPPGSAATDPANSDSPGYVAVLPLSDTHARASLHRAGGDESDGNTSAAAGNDACALAVSADTGDAAVLLPDTLGVMLVAAGPDPFRLVQRLVLTARQRLREQLGVECSGEEGPAEAVTLVSQEAGFVDKLGWCTWDSFYTMVTPEGIMEGLSGFHERGVRPRWVVIDDGWQRTTNDDALNTEQWAELLVGLEANKRFRRFDDEGKMLLDLGDTVAKMKNDFGVEDVMTWHAMAGYWAGVAPEAEEMQRFEPFIEELVAPEGIQQVDPQMQPAFDLHRFGMVPAKKVESFYRAYHGYLKDNGIDGVKVDVQSILDCMGGGNGGVPTVTRAYHEGLCRSVQASFQEGDRPPPLIHCMCHAPSVLFHIAAVYQNRVVLRGSDDFYPREPSSHGPHLYTNAYNALLFSNLGVQDWDMFQSGLGCKSKNEAVVGVPPDDGVEDDRKVDETKGATTDGTTISWFHAAARAVSGGPVYVSDRPGQHNTDIFGKLVLDDGSVLRAKTNALPTLDCLMRDPQLEGGGLLQIWALNAVPGMGVVGSFNIRGASFSQEKRTWISLEDDTVPMVEGTVSPSDVHAFAKEIPTSEGIDEKAEAQGGEDEASFKAGEGRGTPMYAMYLHCQKTARVMCLKESIPLEIPSLGFELATISKVLEIRHPRARDGGTDVSSEGISKPPNGVVLWAAIGLCDMLNSSAAISNQEVIHSNTFDREEGSASAAKATAVIVALSVKGCGRFWALAGRAPNRCSLQASSKGDDGNSSAVALQMSFEPLSEKALTGEGGETGVSSTPKMGVVEVDIPGPWDGREWRLVFEF